MTEEFKKYMTGFNFKRISIATFHEFYNQNGRVATKQQLTKWLSCYASLKGKKLVNTISHNIREYRFDDAKSEINEDVILAIPINEYIVVHQSDLKGSKKIVLSLRFKSNNKYRFVTEQYTGRVLLFRRY
jgi:hypothetical protein